MGLYVSYVMSLFSTCLNLHMLDSSNPSFLYKYQILPKSRDMTDLPTYIKCFTRVYVPFVTMSCVYVLYVHVYLFKLVYVG